MRGRAWETPIAVAQGSTAQRIIAALAYDIVTIYDGRSPPDGRRSRSVLRCARGRLATRILLIFHYNTCIINIPDWRRAGGGGGARPGEFSEDTPLEFNPLRVVCARTRRRPFCSPAAVVSPPYTYTAFRIACAYAPIRL